MQIIQFHQVTQGSFAFRKTLFGGSTFRGTIQIEFAENAPTHEKIF